MSDTRPVFFTTPVLSVWPAGSDVRRIVMAFNNPPATPVLPVIYTGILGNSAPDFVHIQGISVAPLPSPGRIRLAADAAVAAGRKVIVGLTIPINVGSEAAVAAFNATLLTAMAGSPATIADYYSPMVNSGVRNPDYFPVGQVAVTAAGFAAMDTVLAAAKVAAGL